MTYKCTGSWKFLFLMLLTTSGVTLMAQDRMIVTGKVVDAKTQEPLSFATIGVKGRVEETITNATGVFNFSLPVEYQYDTLTVRYVGYHSFQKKISLLQSKETIGLEESYTLLQEVVVTRRKLNLR